MTSRAYDPSAETAPEPEEDGSAPAPAAPAGAWADSMPWSPKNLLVPYLLLALSAYETHGYMLQKYLQGLGFLTTNITTVYRTLRQLEREGLVSSYWQPTEKGPAQRVYSLTATGRAMLSVWTGGLWAGVLEGYRAMIDSFFRLYGLGPSAGPNARHAQPGPSGRRPNDTQEEPR